MLEAPSCVMAKLRPILQPYVYACARSMSFRKCQSVVFLPENHVCTHIRHSHAKKRKREKRKKEKERNGHSKI